MKYQKTTALLALATAFSFSPIALADEKGHAGHEHGDHSEKGEKKEKKHAHGDHDHAEKKAGPNGGRILHSVEPHLEFFVTKERKIQISALDPKGHLIPIAAQSVSLIGGDRAKPTRMSFAKEGQSLLSDKALPAGDKLPVVVMIKSEPGAKSVTEKFILNLSECPSCDYLEYACICDHGHDDHEGHDHDHDHKGHDH